MRSPSVIPKKMRRVQEWFASIIVRPLGQNSQMEMLSPSGHSMIDESASYLLPSPTLQPHERIQIYNQQYWWRLLKTMHDLFPLVVRLFGYTDFNQTISTPYLQAYPSDTWQLNDLGVHLVDWANAHYHATDRSLICDAIQLDHCFDRCFYARSLPPFRENALDIPVTLQPHMHLMTLPYHLLKLRSDLLKEDPDYWVTHDFPKLVHGDHYFVVFRNLRNRVSWEEMSKEEYLLLNTLSSGMTIEQLCDRFEGDEMVEENLQKWFQKWTVREWICHASSDK